MVKIGEVDEQPDADGDEECYEIDPAEFAKKVNLKKTDDVVLVAAKGKIKLEVVEPEEDATKMSSGYRCAATCSRVRESGGVTHDSKHEFAAGDSTDNPCQIEEDEPALLQMEIVEDRFALGKSPPILEMMSTTTTADLSKDTKMSATAVTPYKIVVKAEPDDINGAEGVGHDAYNHRNEMNSKFGADDHKEGRLFHGDKDAVDVVSGELGPKPSKPVENNAVEVIPDNLVAKCEHVGKGAEEDTYDHCLDMIPKPKIIDEEDEDDFVII